MLAKHTKLREIWWQGTLFEKPAKRLPDYPLPTVKVTTNLQDVLLFNNCRYARIGDLITATYDTVKDCMTAAEYVDSMRPEQLSIQIFYEKNSRDIIRFYFYPLDPSAYLAC
jgi:hypothetical protein